MPENIKTSKKSPNKHSLQTNNDFNLFCFTIQYYITLLLE